MSCVDYNFFTNCIRFWTSLYVILLLLFECSYVLIIGAFSFSVILHFILLPPADEIIVNEILGINPRDRLRLLSDAIVSDENAHKRLSSKVHSTGCYKTIAHQAAGLDAPKNSLAAIKMCFNRGCKFIHLDVKLTADNVPVLYSNEYAKQKWMEGLVYLENSVEDVNWENIRNADISSMCPIEWDKFKGETLPVLDDAISLCTDLDMRMIINLVHLNYVAQCSMMIDTVISLYNKYPNLYRRAILSSFNPFILYMIRKKKPEIIVALTWQPTIYFLHPFNCTISWLNKVQYTGGIQKILFETFDFIALWLINNIIYRILNISSIILHKDIITPSIVEQWESKGIRVIASVVNLDVEKAYFSQAIGVAYLTDTLDVM